MSQAGYTVGAGARSSRGWLAILLAISGGAAAHATFPLVTDEADTQDPGTLQIEAGASYETGSEYHHYDVPIALTYGVIPRVDVAVGFGNQFEERTLDDGTTEKVNGIDDLSVAMKWMFLDESMYVPRQTINPSVNFPTADDRKDLGSGKTDYDLTWKASKSIGKKTGMHLNVGYTWVGDPPDEDVGDVVHWGVAADYQIVESLQLIGEVFGEQELKEHETSWQYNAGLRWDVIDNLRLVAAAGSRISGDAPDFTATGGVIWVLGAGKADSNNK